MTNLADDPAYADRVELGRSRLISELEGRPEGFVVNGKLVKLDGPTPSFLPGYEREAAPAKASTMEGRL
jgi:hypothetical protein